jgi:hypothetical protein
MERSNKNWGRNYWTEKTPVKFKGLFGNIFKNVYSNHLENLEVVKFLGAYKLPKLNQDDINYLARSITNKQWDWDSNNFQER